jgi:hypothetical protein
VANLFEENVMPKPLVIDEKPQGRGVTVYLPGDVMDILDDMCAQSGARRSQVVAQLVRNHAGKKR